METSTPSSTQKNTGATGILQRVVIVLEMIKFQHTIFALPFALIAMLLAARDFPDPGNRLPSLRVFALVVVACYAARSAAMAFNRLADLDHDRENPRTKNRALVIGLLTPRFVWVFTAAHVALFVAAAWLLNPLALYLSPAALVVILGYSYFKRFTWLTHFVLGLALAIAPLGAWVAVRGTLELQPVLLALAVLFWTAGFDIIYACQDYDFDVQAGVHSIPARIGIGRGLAVSSACHLVAWLALVGFAGASGWGPFFLAGVILTGGLLIYEHRIVRPDDLSRIGVAFFTVNGMVGIVLLCCFLVDLLVAPT